MKITFGKPKVSVVKEKTIIYKLPWRVNFGYNEGNLIVREQIKACLLNLLCSTTEFKLSGMAKGVATCADIDTFSYDLGVALAESRAKQKIYAKATHIADTLEGYLDTAMIGLHADTHSNLLEDEIEHQYEIEKHSAAWVEHRKEVRRKRKNK